jgi:hypothetical protein
LDGLLLDPAFEVPATEGITVATWAVAPAPTERTMIGAL